MRLQRPDLRLLVVLASAAMAMPAWGQTIPDFSGVWAKPYVGIEPPRSGPGPVTNRSRRNGARNVYQYVGDYTNPILKPEAADIVRKHGEISQTGEDYPTPRNQCWPQGVPGIFPDTEMQMVQQPDKITILYEEDHEIRHIRMNQPHPAQVTPSWYGDSVGHYEGDTLVIDTVGVKIGPFGMLDFYGTPYTAALHIVERYRLIDYEAAKEAHEWGQERMVSVAAPLTTTTRARGFRFNSPSRMQASSRCPGRRPQRIGAPWVNGRKWSVPRAYVQPSSQKTAPSRRRRSQISEVPKERVPSISTV